MLKVFKNLVLIGVCTLPIAAGTINEKKAEGQDQSALLARPQLACGLGDSHPGLHLHLKITNNGSSDLAPGTKIHYSYQLSSGALVGQHTLQLSKPLLAGKSFELAVDEAKRKTFQSCTASVASPVIKLPVLLERKR